MKGATLAINMLIIFLIVIIVLIAAMALFTGVWGQSSSGLALDAAKNSGCQKYVSLGGCSGSVTPDQVSVKKIKCDSAPADGTDIDNLDKLREHCFNDIGIEILCSC